jgi:hypothetical protein
MAPSPTTILDRLERIRAKKNQPSRFATLYPVPMAPFVRAAREGRLTPTVVCGGTFVPRGDGEAA